LEDCQNHIVGGLFSFTGISAKERKRTALAVELITDPNLIFLDEPTSGLDSENAFTMIKMLKKETISRGASVICTLHQPSSDLFQLFDRVICLSEGHVIY
jgi:ABC-type multidrug transport system ATPase subunit